MCGIAGIIQNSPLSYGIQDLRRMSDSISHRGPNGRHDWSGAEGTVLMAHCRLSIIDLGERAAQPMHFSDRYTIIHNGEIYNYRELREDLKKEGYSFRTESDTEVILAAFDHYGDECVEHFDGMFAFAIWDQEEEELFAARDRFGEKPFYYVYTGTEFIFASELKALWALGIERKPNLQMLFNFITIGYTDNPGRPGETFFEDVYRLPAASRLYYEPGAGEPLFSKYWSLDPDVMDLKITDAEAIEKFSNLLHASVKRRLRSDVPVGTSLSGGLDSSSIAAIASKDHSATEPFAAFTAVFPGYEKNEYPFASQVSSLFNLQLNTAEITADHFIDDWEKFLSHQEEPFGSASAYAQYKVYQLAAQHRVKVLLDGQGADETLAGYGKYYNWYWQELFQKRRLMRSGELKAAKELGVKETFNYKNVVAALFPEIASVVLEKQYLANAIGHEDLTAEFVRLQSKEAYYTRPETSGLNGALYFNTAVHGLEELLRLADRNSMAHGVEVRLPFLEHQLVEFIFSLPSHFKIRKGWTKWLLRQTMDKVLPPEICWRKEKVGFEPPQKLWMQDSRVKEMIREAKRTLVNEKILKPEVLDKPVVPGSSHDAGSFDWRYLSSGYFLK